MRVTLRVCPQRGSTASARRDSSDSSWSIVFTFGPCCSQHSGDRLVEGLGDLVAQFEVEETICEWNVAHDRDSRFARRANHRLCELVLAFGDHLGRALLALFVEAKRD